MIEGIAQTIECPNNSCNILIDDVTIMDIVKDPKVKQRYQLLITNIFVDCNKLLRWCPIPKCGHAVKVQYIDAKPVICNCKHIFCFRCGENWHAPVNCNILRKWNQKCKEDTGTSKWMALNTKPCPKCQALIQKIDGCNYMRCPRCSTPFCWFCLHPWKHAFHSWNNCKQLNRKKIADTKYAQEKTKTDLEKYIFYKDKYMHHMFFLKHEDILHDKVEEKTKEMQNLNKSWIEVQFLKTAADILCYCRRILMYTYVFAYYIQQNNQTVILEDNLQDLENAVEILVGYLHQDVDEQNLSDMNQKVRNQYNYCDSRRKVLLEHVQEGNDKHWWTFDD
ncbi:E3 ubiquitin-protein ligase arih1-like [Phymastichus coffea]|uniref:E3 ubiquitin-protein ligase arih1-like n=1 Tax=Phymastichus coffea TaxID=108790 RepID=UPI00273B10C7|nr:E3 ubiquitin-protein ligase arih1-like [Phymastichus coffea]